MNKLRQAGVILKDNHVEVVRNETAPHDYGFEERMGRLHVFSSDLADLAFGSRT